MISGVVSFYDPITLFEAPAEITGDNGITFYPVKHDYFNGGFFLHSGLPYLPEEVYFVDRSRDIMVLLSGVLYNRQTIIQSEKIDREIPDPELIADLFLKYGTEFVADLNGDFAFFILRAARKEAFLFRDHIGARPLAWAGNGKTIHFSTDINSLCKTYKPGTVPDREFLLSYFKYIDFRRTPNKNVSRLAPGHFLNLSEAGIEIIKYWEPELIRTDRNLTYDKMICDLSGIVRDAVKIRCDQRFIAGAHVSGGIDSGLISALARQEYTGQKDFFGFSWSPSLAKAAAAERDERDLVLKMCQHVVILPSFSDMDESDFLRFISGYYSNKGYFSEEDVTERALRLKINLIFSGFGGDEFISTGHSGIDLDLLLRLKFRIFFRRFPISKPKRLIKYFLFYVINPAFGLLDKKTRKGFRDDARYLRKQYKKSDKQALSSFYFHRSRHQMHLKMLDFYYIPERCESWHSMGFRKGIEYRYPLLDKRIIEYMLKVPSELLCMTNHFRPILRVIGKGILSDSVRLNESKNDPVYWAWIDEHFKKAAVNFMEELDSWRRNPDLFMFDFDLLSEDVAGYKTQFNHENHRVLFRTLVYIKAIQEFTLSYRRMELS